MVFSSVIFVCFFLSFTIIGSILLKNRYSNAFLLVMNLIFYAWGEPRFVYIFLISMVSNYIFGLLIHYFKNKRFFLGMGVVLT